MDIDCCGVDGLAEEVRSLAHVGASVLAPRVQDVESDVAKVVSCTETVPRSYGYSVHEPLDPHVGVVDRLHSALQMRVVSLLQG